MKTIQVTICLGALLMIGMFIRIHDLSNKVKLLGDELDNVEMQYHVDKESVQP